MRLQGFIGPSYTMQSVVVDAQRCINLYPEMDEAGTGKEGEVASLVSTPGLKLLVTLPLAPIRCVYCASNGDLYAVGGNTLYKISSTWGYTALGTLNTSVGYVSMADNGLELVLVDGPFGYQYTFASGAYAQITDVNFLGATQVTFMDGYLIFTEPNSDQFFISPINAVTPFDALDVGTAEANPDNIVGQIVDQEALYLFGSQSLEVFYDSGNSGFPFERIQGAVIELGCSAAFSVAKIGNAVYWLGQDISGRGIVYRIQGFQPQRISTHALERVISGLGDMSNARAWTYQQSGHSFYCLNLPGAQTTWVYDQTTNLWHERADMSTGVYQRHAVDSHAFAFNTNVAGDFSTGNIYSLDPTVYTDNGNPLIRERTAPHISKDMERIFHSRFILDVETGVGLDGTRQGTNPQAMLQWSNDGGRTWSNEHWTTIGAIGAFRPRATWRRLGYARDRVYRVRISDPVKVTLIGAELDLGEGAA